MIDVTVQAKLKAIDSHEYDETDELPEELRELVDDFVLDDDIPWDEEWEWEKEAEERFLEIEQDEDDWWGDLYEELDEQEDWERE